MAIASRSDAFEQGSYYVIDLVETAEAAPVAGRLAVPKSVLAGRGTAETPASPLEERSEFEIDYAKGLLSASHSAFELDASAEPATEPESSNFSTSTFDFGSSNTVFGE